MLDAVWGLYRIELDLLKEYIGELEIKFKSDLCHLYERYQKEIENITDRGVKDQIAEIYGEDHHIIDTYFLRLFRYSSVMAIHSYLEKTLFDLSIYLRYAFQIRAKNKEISGFDKSINFIRNQCQVEVPMNSKKWTLITDFIKVRDCVVHCDGNIELSRDYKHLNKMVKKGQDLNIQSNNELVIGGNYLRRILEGIDVFLHDLHDHVYSRIKTTIDKEG